ARRPALPLQAAGRTGRLCRRRIPPPGRTAVRRPCRTALRAPRRTGSAERRGPDRDRKTAEGAPQMSTWLVDTAFYTGILIALVLVLRRPVARVFGPNI